MRGRTSRRWRKQDARSSESEAHSERGLHVGDAANVPLRHRLVEGVGVLRNTSAQDACGADAREAGVLRRTMNVLCMLATRDTSQDARLSFMDWQPLLPRAPQSAALEQNR